MFSYILFDSPRNTNPANIEKKSDVFQGVLCTDLGKLVSNILYAEILESLRFSNDF